MRVMYTDSLNPGSVLEQDLLDATGNTILYRGVRLTEAYIKGLQQQGYVRLYARDEGESETGLDDNLTLTLRVQATEALREVFDRISGSVQVLKREALADLERAFDSSHIQCLLGDDGPISRISGLASQIVDEVLTQNTLAGLVVQKHKHRTLHEHALNVCAVAILVGKVVDLPNQRLRQLAAGCLLHDIGMAFFHPGDVESLDESRRIIGHTILGYELLRGLDERDVLAPRVAYEHHERQDGTGLPRGLVGSNAIDRLHTSNRPSPTLIGEIAAIANHYDVLLSGRPGHEPLTPDEALTEITRLAGTWFNREVVEAFRRAVPVYPKGAQVLVRGGQYDRFLGIVVEVYPENLNRPAVLLVKDPSGSRITAERYETQGQSNVVLKTVSV